MSPQVLQLQEESCRNYQQVPLYCQHTGISEFHYMAQGNSNLKLSRTPVSDLT